MNNLNNTTKRRDFMVDCGKMTGVTAFASAVNLGMLGSVAANTVGSAASYRAVVNIVLGGGIDSFSFFAPGSDEEFQHYKNIRRARAFSEGSFTKVATANDGDIRIHNNFGKIRQMFNAGELAIVPGVGTLVEPLVKANNFRGQKPHSIGSHFDQSVSWQNSVPNMRGGSVAGTGWIGRMMEVLRGGHNDSGVFNPMIDLGGGYSLRGYKSKGLQIGTSGPNKLDIYANNANVRSTIDADLETNYKTVLQKHIQHTRKSNIDSMQTLDDLSRTVRFKTKFPNSNLGRKLSNVAKYIALRKNMGLNRQVFSVSDGGHDAHTRTNPRVAAAMSQINAALFAFNSALKELGLNDNVVTYLSSDFGRTFTANNTGTNHGWAGHTLVMGGGVRPKTVVGGFPSYAPGADIHRASRPLPQIATDQLFGSIAYWFGMDNDSNMKLMLPNIRNFRSASSGAENANDPFLNMFTNSSLVGRRG